MLFIVSLALLLPLMTTKPTWGLTVSDNGKSAVDMKLHPLYPHFPRELMNYRKKIEIINANFGEFNRTKFKFKSSPDILLDRVLSSVNLSPNGNEPLVVVEIGSAFGDSLFAMWEVLVSHASSPGSHHWLVSVDVWHPQLGHTYDAWERFLSNLILEGLGEESHLAAVRLPSLVFTARYWAARPGELPPLDFVFLDTQHLYPNTLWEIEGIWSVLRSCGYLAGHDYGVKRDSFGYYYGVKRAVHEFVSSHPDEMEDLDLEEWSGGDKQYHLIPVGDYTNKLLVLKYEYFIIRKKC